MEKNSSIVIDNRFKPGDVVWKIHYAGPKTYHIFATKVQGVALTENDGFQYVTDIGGPTAIKDLFAEYDGAVTEAHRRWAFEKEDSKLVGPGTGLIVPQSDFAKLLGRA